MIAETVVDCMGDAVLAVDTDGRTMTVNPVARRLLERAGASGDVAHWSERYDFFHADRQTPFPTEDLPLMRALHGEPSDNVELVVSARETDELTHYSATARPLLDSAGRSMGGVVVFHDSTPFRETKERLQESVDELKRQKRLMDDVLNSMSDGVVAVDERNRFVLVNRVVRLMVGDIDDGCRHRSSSGRRPTASIVRTA